MSAFESQTLHRLATETARFWFIEHYLRTKQIPSEVILWTYSRNMDWGDELLCGKRIRITIEVEDHDQFAKPGA